MKAPLRGEQFVTDATGKRVAVLLDLPTYDRLREAEEELSDIRAYEAAKPKVHAEIKAGKFDDLSSYLTNRTVRRK